MPINRDRPSHAEDFQPSSTARANHNFDIASRIVQQTLRDFISFAAKRHRISPQVTYHNFDLFSRIVRQTLQDFISFAAKRHRISPQVTSRCCCWTAPVVSFHARRDHSAMGGFYGSLKKKHRWEFYTIRKNDSVSPSQRTRERVQTHCIPIEVCGVSLCATGKHKHDCRANH
jgi:hypothetical protein